VEQQSMKWDHLLWAGGGILAGAWWVRNQDEESKKSRAERDDPMGVRDVCEIVGQVLDEWEPDEMCESEDDFTDDLAEWLSQNTDWVIEVRPNGREGEPDILVADLLALELKINPSKSERDRCVGQTAGYSREWVTWIVLIDAAASRVGSLEKLLSDKRLERILVWNFA